MKELLEKIHQTGYWRTSLRPKEYKSDKFLDHQSTNFAIVNSVFNRSQLIVPYPYLTPYAKSANDNDGVEYAIDEDSVGIVQYWKLFFSGQFVHHFTMREDYYWKEGSRPPGRWLSAIDVDTFLAIDGVISTTTWFFMFASQLYEKLDTQDGLDYSITLHGTEGRGLYYSNSSRMFPFLYKCEKPSIELTGTISNEALLSGDLKIPLAWTLRILAMFNWNNPHVPMIERDQAEMLSGGSW